MAAGNSTGSSSSTQKSESKRFEELTVIIPKRAGEAIGVFISDDLIIGGINPKAAAYGKLKVQDRVTRVNGKQVRDAAHFAQLVFRGFPEVSIQVARQARSDPEQQFRNFLPPERAKNCEFRRGYVYQLVRIEMKPKVKFGLAIKDSPIGVLVSMVADNSLTSGILRPGDHIVDIDSKPVRTIDECRQAMARSLHTKEYFTAVIERAESADAQQEIRAIQVGIYDGNYAPSVRMSVDVRKIAAQQLRNMQTNVPPAKRKLIRSKRIDPKDKRVKLVPDRPAVFIIANDNVGKELRPVRKARQEVYVGQSQSGQQGSHPGSPPAESQNRKQEQGKPGDERGQEQGQQQQTDETQGHVEQGGSGTSDKTTPKSPKSE